MLQTFSLKRSSPKTLLISRLVIDKSSNWTEWTTIQGVIVLGVEVVLEVTDMSPCSSLYFMIVIDHECFKKKKLTSTFVKDPSVDFSHCNA